MSKPIQDQAALDAHRKREQLPAESEEVVPVEPCRINAPCTVPVKPGYAAAARRAGCEDEYDNAMQARFGEGW